VVQDNNIDDVLNLLQRLKDELPTVHLEPDQEERLAAEVSSVEAEVKSPQPKAGVIKAGLGRIWRILEEAGGQVLALAVWDALAKLPH
jgi:hypothetical protein